MYFLVDFENVHNAGLEGTEYLNNTDTLMIFYSGGLTTIKQYRLDDILHSGCQWKNIKLVRTGKNALDYYIATCVGEILGQNHDETIAIISCDKGFLAVLDYWKDRLPNKKQLVVGHTISAGLSDAFDTSRRDSIVRADNALRVLEKEYAKYEESNRVKAQITENFKGSSYENMLPEIIKIIKYEPTPRAKYLASLRSFGLKDGVDVYRKIKLINFSGVAS